MTARHFTQLPPCFEKLNIRSSIVIECNKNTRRPDYRIPLLRTFEIVVMENMRHAKDPEYGSHFRRHSLGNQIWNTSKLKTQDSLTEMTISRL